MKFEKEDTKDTLLLRRNRNAKIWNVIRIERVWFVLAAKNKILEMTVQKYKRHSLTTKKSVVEIWNVIQIDRVWFVFGS
jgi:hypothetical protein